MNARSSAPPTKKKEFSLKRSMEDVFSQLVRDKQIDKRILIPAKFYDLYNSKVMYHFLSTVYSYFAAFFFIQDKQSKEDETLMETSELEILEGRSHAMAQAYAATLLKFSSFDHVQEDQNFFETFYFYVARVMQSAFERRRIHKLESELGRLFRTEVFNMTRRTIENGQNRRVEPNLKISNAEDRVNAIINWYTDKRHPSHKPQATFAPKHSAHSAVYSRSPMIALLLPSPRDRVQAFERDRKQQRSQRSSSLNTPRQTGYSIMRSTRMSIGHFDSIDIHASHEPTTSSRPGSRSVTGGSRTPDSTSVAPITMMS